MPAATCGAIPFPENKKSGRTRPLFYSGVKSTLCSDEMLQHPRQAFEMTAFLVGQKFENPP